MGVSQGGFLSPLLLIVYLEEAQKSKDTLWRAVQQGNLLTYADDMVLHAASAQNLNNLIRDLQGLEVNLGLRLNVDKSEILGDPNARENDRIGG